MRLGRSCALLAMAALCFMAVAPAPGRVLAAAPMETRLADANADSALTRAEIAQGRKAFRAWLAAKQTPPGWRRLGGDDLRRALSGKRFRSHYLQGRGEVFDYAFFPNGRAIRFRVQPRGVGSRSDWQVKGDYLDTWLNYVVVTDGRLIGFIRKFQGRFYGEVTGIGKPIGFPYQ